MKTNISYPTWDNLCKVFFDEKLLCFQNGKYIGNPIGLWLRESIDCAASSSLEVKTPKALILNSIIKAKRDTSSDAVNFLKDINLLLTVSGEVSYLSGETITLLLDRLNDKTISHETKKLTITYIRNFCELINPKASSDIRLRVASVAVKHNCAASTDYCELIRKEKKLEQQEVFIEPLIKTARRELNHLLKKQDINNVNKVVHICDAAIYGIECMGIPAELISTVHDEFSFIKKEWQLYKRIALDNDLINKTNELVSEFVNKRKALKKKNLISQQIKKKTETFETRPEIVQPQLKTINAEPVTNQNKASQIKVEEANEYEIIKSEPEAQKTGITNTEKPTAIESEDKRAKSEEIKSEPAKEQYDTPKAMVIEVKSKILDPESGTSNPKLTKVQYKAPKAKILEDKFETLKTGSELIKLKAVKDQYETPKAKIVEVESKILDSDSGTPKPELTKVQHEPQKAEVFEDKSGTVETEVIKTETKVDEVKPKSKLDTANNIIYSNIGIYSGKKNIIQKLFGRHR